MHINWQYLKRPGVIVAGIVLFFVVLLLVNRSGGGSGTIQAAPVAAGNNDALQMAAINEDYAKSQDTNATQVALAQLGVNAGATQTAAQLQIAMATIAANLTAEQNQTGAQVAISQMGANVQALGITAQQQIANATIAFQSHALDVGYATDVVNNQASLGMATLAYNASLASQQIAAAVTSQQIAASLSSQQLATNANLIAQFGAPDRREQLTQQLFQMEQGSNVTPVEVRPAGGGGFNPITLISPVLTVAGAFA